MIPLRTQSPTLGTIVRWVLYVALAIGLLWYGIHQARLLIAGPTLTLDEVAVVHEAQVTTVSGVAQNVTSLSLNGRPIFTDEAGRFSERLVLERGYTIMTVRARDRYGREQVLTRPLVYAPAYRAQN